MRDRYRQPKTFVDPWTGKEYDYWHDVPRWNTFRCPLGHEVEDCSIASTNRGLRCNTCANLFRCQACGYEHDGNQGFSWVDSMTLAELGIIKKGNWRDGGVYALCPTCRKGTMVLRVRAWWYTVEELLKDDGTRIGRNEHANL